MIATDLRDLALVQQTHPLESTRALEQLASKAGQQLCAGVGRRHEPYRVSDITAQVVLDPVEVIEQDLEETSGVDHLFGEPAALLERFDASPIPWLGEFLVGRIVED